MTTTVQYIIFEQRAYIDRWGHLVAQFDEHYEVVTGAMQDELILMFRGSL